MPSSGRLLVLLLAWPASAGSHYGRSLIQEDDDPELVEEGHRAGHRTVPPVVQTRAVHHTGHRARATASAASAATAAAVAAAASEASMEAPSSSAATDATFSAGFGATSSASHTRERQPHVCLITSHDKHLTPTMPSCAATEGAVAEWAAQLTSQRSNGSSSLDRLPSDAEMMLASASATAEAREAWTLRLATCASLAAACDQSDGGQGFSFILANAPASFSRLDPNHFAALGPGASAASRADLRLRLARLDGACRRAGATLDDRPASGQLGGGAHWPTGEAATPRASARRPPVSAGLYGASYSWGGGDPDAAVCGDDNDEAAAASVWASDEWWGQPASASVSSLGSSLGLSSLRLSSSAPRGRSWCGIALLREAVKSLPECDVVGWVHPTTVIHQSPLRALAMTRQSATRAKAARHQSRSRRLLARGLTQWGGDGDEGASNDAALQALEALFNPPVTPLLFASRAPYNHSRDRFADPQPDDSLLLLRTHATLKATKQPDKFLDTSLDRGSASLEAFGGPERSSERSGDTSRNQRRSSAGASLEVLRKWWCEPRGLLQGSLGGAEPRPEPRPESTPWRSKKRSTAGGQAAAQAAAFSSSASLARLVSGGLGPEVLVAGLEAFSERLWFPSLEDTVMRAAAAAAAQRSSLVGRCREHLGPPATSVGASARASLQSLLEARRKSFAAKVEAKRREERLQEWGQESVQPGTPGKYKRDVSLGSDDGIAGSMAQSLKQRRFHPKEVVQDTLDGLPDARFESPQQTRARISAIRAQQLQADKQTPAGEAGAAAGGLAAAGDEASSRAEAVSASSSTHDGTGQSAESSEGTATSTTPSGLLARVTTGGSSGNGSSGASPNATVAAASGSLVFSAASAVASDGRDTGPAGFFRGSWGPAAQSAAWDLDEPATTAETPSGETPAVGFWSATDAVTDWLASAALGDDRGSEAASPAVELSQSAAPTGTGRLEAAVRVVAFSVAALAALGSCAVVALRSHRNRYRRMFPSPNGSKGSAWWSSLWSLLQWLGAPMLGSMLGDVSPVHPGVAALAGESSTGLCCGPCTGAASCLGCCGDRSSSQGRTVASPYRPTGFGPTSAKTFVGFGPSGGGNSGVRPSTP